MAKVLEEDDKVKSAYEEALSKFGHRPYVTAIDVGPKYIEGKKTDELTVRIHVAEKKDKSVLESSEIFPEHIQGVKIDIIQGRYGTENRLERLPVSSIEASDRTRRQTVMRPGVSIGHKSSTAGTLGMFVKDNKSKRIALLSNWHVLAGARTARPGDEILQPGPFDGGKLPGDVVASLERMLLDKDGDAAIALINSSRKWSATIFGTDQKITALARPERGDVVTKSGRTTGITRGVIEGTGVYFITYSVGRVGVEGFIIVPEDRANPSDTEISEGGDSGSIWIDEKTGSAVGLHFAGETNPLPGEEHAIACDITRVFLRLDISLLPVAAKEDEPAPRDASAHYLANDLGEMVGTAVLDTLDGRDIRRFASALASNYPRLSDADEINRMLADGSAPEIGPFGAVAVGFAAGAAARLLGSAENVEARTPEAFPVVVAAFLAGAAAGARAVDGKL